MSKEVSAGAIVSPSSLWGKPLPKTLHKTDTKKEKDAGMLPEDDVTDDVDAELEGDGPSDADLEAEEADVEASDDTEAGDEEPSYDDESDEDDDSDDEEVDATVDADEDDVSKKKKVTTPMAGKKKSMSDHVREEIARRQESGDSLRGVDIMGALSKKGVKVSAAQISQLLKKAGVGKSRSPKKAKEAGEEKSRVAVSTRKVTEAPRAANKVKPATGGVIGLPVTRLKAAKDFIAACGNSYEEAMNALELHQQLHDVL